MKSTSQTEITNIVEDAKFSKSDKIEKLLVIREDCRAAERAATESRMTNEDTLGSDLKIADEALDSLGYDVHNIDGTTATL